ncbi:MAG: hypothetical protein NTZ28_08170, partial [Nitrospirae bacterium]|nr:hypothetical protein [Nitrospirota bacterium]
VQRRLVHLVYLVYLVGRTGNSSRRTRQTNPGALREHRRSTGPVPFFSEARLWIAVLLALLFLLPPPIHEFQPQNGLVMEAATNFAHYLLYPEIVVVITIVFGWHCLQLRDWSIHTKLVRGSH